MKHALSGVLRGSLARALHVPCRSACSRTAPRAVVAVPVAGVLLAVILALGLHVNLSASAPRGLYRTVPGRPMRGAWVEGAAVDPLLLVDGLVLHVRPALGGWENLARTH